MLTFGSLFAGVGGFDLGFEAAGYDCGFQVEWDKHCQQVLAYRWPDVPRWGDVSEVNGADLPAVDVITYGFPCQDLSVAGKRRGLDGERSHLFFEAVRIIREMREATDGRYPTWAVAENVAGLLNADGGFAMGRVVDELADAGAVVIEWTTLDAQHFGVPQRRRRVFIASCFDPATAQRCPDPLFPVGTGSSRDTQTSKEPRQGIATDTETCVADGDQSDRQHIANTFPTLLAGDGTKWGSNQWVDEGKAIIEPTWWDGGEQRTTTAVVFDPSRRDGARVQGDTSNTLTGHMGTGGNNTPMVAQRRIVAPTLTAANDPSRSPQSSEITQQVAAVVEAQIQSIALSAGNSAQAIGMAAAIPIQDGREIEKHQNGLGVGDAGDPAYTLDTTGGQAVAQPDLAVRRLTPVECERLMGWPDDHTLHRADGKTNADSSRYKMCGNGVVAPVAAWLAKHLAKTFG